MKPTLTLLTILLLTPLAAFAQPQPAAAAASHPARPLRFLYNSDGNHLFYGEKRPDDPQAAWPLRTVHRATPMTVAELLAPVDEVAGTQVDTFLVCAVNNQVVLFKSKLEKRPGVGATREQIEASASNLRNVAEAIREFDRLGVDPYKLIVERIREKGMRPMLAWRVQQAHVISGKERSLVLSPFVEAHPELRIRGASGGDSESSLDFASPLVRQRKIDLIREFVGNYGVEGCELDFQRFPLFFSKGKEEAGLPLMNEFVRGVRDAIDAEGAKTGTRMILGVRIPETPSRCRSLGLAPAEWVNQGLVDYVVVSSFLHQNPVALGRIPGDKTDFAGFRKMFTRPVPLLGCLQVSYRFYDADRKTRPAYRLGPDEYRREAAALWSQGVDGIEMFNFFMPRAMTDERGGRSEPPTFLLHELGDPKAIGQRSSPEEERWRRLYPLKPIPAQFLPR